METRLLAFDVESYLITQRDKAPKPVCCAWWDGNGQPFLTHPSDDQTLALFSNPEAHFVGHNIPYDLVVMMRWCPWLIPHIICAVDQGRVWDTQIREQLLHLELIGEKGFQKRISLDNLGQKYLGVDRSAQKKGDDIWRLKYGTLDGLPFSQWPKEATQYALDDAVETYQVFWAQGAMAGAVATEALQVQAGVSLQLTSTWGFHVNQENVALMQRYLEEDMVPLRQKLDEFSIDIDGKPTGLTGGGSKKAMQLVVLSGWRKFYQVELEKLAQEYQVVIHWDALQVFWDDSNWDLTAWLTAYKKNKWAGLPEWCYNAIQWNPPEFMSAVLDRIPPIPRSKTGLKTGEDDIQPIIPYVEILSTRAKWKHLDKMRSTYVEPYIGMEEVHPSYNVVVTTGRTSCSNPNLQNVPRTSKERPREAYRKNLRARPGYKLGTVDYSMQELCTLAATILERYGKSEMADYINRGVDLHCLSASWLFGASYETISENRKEAPFSEWRQGCKALNFGAPGGLGALAFQAYAKAQYGVDWSFEETKRNLRAWKDNWPEVKRYLQDNGDLCDSSDGRRATAWNNMGRKKANCTYTQLSNYSFQSLAADCTKTAMWNLAKHNLLGWFWTEAPPDIQMRAYRLSSGHTIPEYTQAFRNTYEGSPLRRSHTANMIHDEIVQEHPDDLAEEAFALQQTIMVDSMAQLTPGVTPRVEGMLHREWDH